MNAENPNSSEMPAERHTPRRGAAGTILRHAPTVIVLAALGGIAWWGHHTGWKGPTFSDVSGKSESADKEDWCSEHNVPDSTCIACHPELAGGNPADWCKEHGVAESRCTVCHPEVLTKGVAGDWCREHGVPESGCTACHAEMAIKGTLDRSDSETVLPPNGTAASSSTRPVAGVAANHEKPDMSRAQSPTTRPGKDPKTCQTHAHRVQFASADAVKKAGVKLAIVGERPMTGALTVNAETDYDGTRFAQIASPVSGRVWRVEKEVGQVVKKGDILALVDSAEIGKAKAELLEAIATADLKQKTLKRVSRSAESGSRTEAEVQEAEAAAREAEVRLFNTQQALLNLGLPLRREDLSKPVQELNIQYLGIPAELVKTFDATLATANLAPIVSPFDGIVIERKAVAGEMADPSKPLMAVADTSQIWVMMDLPLTDARRVSLGQDVVFRTDTVRDEAATGKVTWISTAVDDQTRTLKVRAQVQNPNGRLPAKAWGRAQIVLRETPNAIAIPDEAIQWEGCCYVAFVRLNDTIFQTRKLRIGAKANGYTEVIIGVLPGEVIVTGGSSVLKADILKANLGAGCVDD